LWLDPPGWIVAVVVSRDSPGWQSVSARARGNRDPCLVADPMPATSPPNGQIQLEAGDVWIGELETLLAQAPQSCG